MNIFKSIYAFFSRIRTAWKVSRDPRALEAIGQLKDLAQNQRENDLYQEQVEAAVHDFVADICLPAARHEMRFDDPRQPVVLKVRSEKLMNVHEADAILNDARIGFELKPHSKDATNALVEHNQKYNKRN